MSKNTVPNHIAFIMDGNRRWARGRGLPTLEGHRRGYDNILAMGKECLKRGITIMTVYAFSTENWNRSKREVSYLMKLLKRGLTEELHRFQQEGIQLRIIGEKKGLPKDVAEAARYAEQFTAKNTRGILNIAINYGGRHEIIHAVKEIIKAKLRESEVTLQKLQSYLYTANLPDPDLIIRTSGELRLSNFLLWQLAYSELYFSQCHWPDFNSRELSKALTDFAQRQRRYGK